MPTDYDKLREENIGRYGSETAHLAILGELYAERTHFIFELLQNSEDAKAKHVRFKLEPDGLQLLHDGRSFNAADVRAVCSVCQSTSQGDSDRIGRFGIGFKSVYCYTATPEIHSGDEHFAIEHYVRPKAVAEREIAEGHSTLIALPFTSPSVTSETAFGEITSAFQALDQSALLFLRHVESLEVKVEGEDDIVLGRKIISRPEKWIRLVSLVADEDDSDAQRWLVTERSCKLKGTTGKSVSARVEIAFALASTEADSGITVENHDGATLAVFFPTDKPTNTGFILHGPYRTTPARDNILVKDPINERLVLETCALLVETLCWLRDQDSLTTEVFHTLPLSRADFPKGSLLHPLFEHVLAALREQPLLPAYADSPDSPKFICGNQAVAASDPELRELLTNDELKEALGGDTDWRWLSEDISLDDQSALAVYLRDEIEVQEFTADNFVSWLETKDADWWKGLDEESLLSAYRYLNDQPSEHKRLRKLPLVRLESGEHVSPDEQAVFFPADNNHEKKELAPFLSQLPIIRLSLLDDDEDKTVESFLRKVGVTRLVASEFIKHYFIPRYQGTNSTTVEEDLALGRYLFRAFQRMSEDERDEASEQLSQIEWLLCRKASQPDTLSLEKPGDAYLGIPYAENSDLDDYFSASPETCFVHEDYHEEEEDWLTFLVELGSSDIPRRPGDMHIMDGLDNALAALRAKTEADDRIRLVNSMVSVIAGHVPDDEWERNSCFQIRETIWGPRGGNHGSRNVDAKFWVTLKQSSWLPDSIGKLRKPNALFEDNQQNRRLLSDSVAYLHTGVVLDDEEAKWLAAKMGIRFTPNKEAVLTCLKKLCETGVALEQVLPLYEFLSRTVGPEDADVFEGGKLIFCPDSDQKWRPPSEVFWNDESSVFGSTRAYLKNQYPSLHDFFLKVGVQASASPSDYAQALLEISDDCQVTDDSRIRIHRIFKRLELLFNEGGEWMEDENWEEIWTELQAGRSWIGRKGDGFDFYRLSELAVVDNEHLETLFYGKVAFWPFKDLNDFAKAHLEVETCSSAEKDFEIESKEERQDTLSEQLASIWPSIGDFLQSDKWRDNVLDDREFIDTPPLIRAVGKIAVIYTLKEVEAEEPDGKAAFFDSAENTVWLVPNDPNEGDEHFESLSEALQEHYGPEPLREFIYDLFRKGTDKTKLKWKKRGLMSRSAEIPDAGESQPDPKTELQPAPSKPNHEPETKPANDGPGEDTSSGKPSQDTKQASPDKTPSVPRTSPGNGSTETTPRKPTPRPNDPVPDPDRRKKGIIEHRENAPSRESVKRERSIQLNVSEEIAKAKAYLRIRCRNSEEAVVCQCCHEEMPFKIDGMHYFEAVQCVRGQDKIYYENHLALCPNCAAMYKHARTTNDDEMLRRIVSHAEADTVAIVDIPVTLAGKERILHFGGKHWFDLKTILNPHLD